jgi:hypothetical protein
VFSIDCYGREAERAPCCVRRLYTVLQSLESTFDAELLPKLILNRLSSGRIGKYVQNRERNRLKACMFHFLSTYFNV